MGGLFTSEPTLHYDMKELLPPKFEGWFGEQNKQVLAQIILYKQPKRVVEVGSWLGLSTSFIAQELESDAILYAVDHFEGSIEHKLHCRDYLPTLFDQFRSNMIHAKVDQKVVPVRASSLEASQILNETFDLIYIDASHDEESVFQDLELWYKKLSPTGILSGDDYDWTDPLLKTKSVANAVKRFSLLHNLHLYIGRNVWVMSKEDFALDFGEAPSLDYRNTLKKELQQKPIKTAVQVGEDLGFLSYFTYQQLEKGAKLYVTGPYISKKRFEIFKSNIKNCSLEDKIIPLEMTLEAALPYIEQPIDFTYYHMTYQQSSNLLRPRIFV